MAAQDKNTLKTYFETGDKPTQAQFGDLIDSMRHEGDPFKVDHVVQFPATTTSSGVTLVDLAHTIVVPSSGSAPRVAVLFETTGSTTIRIVNYGGATLVERSGVTGGPALVQLLAGGTPWPSVASMATIKVVSAATCNVKLHSIHFETNP